MPPPQKIFRLLLRPLLARRQNFMCMKILVQHWFRLSDRSLISQATPFTDEACETTIVCYEERKVVRRKTRKSSFALFTAILQVSRCQVCGWGPCVGVCRAQVSHRWRKKQSSWNWTNRTGSYGPEVTGEAGISGCSRRLDIYLGVCGLRTHAYSCWKKGYLTSIKLATEGKFHVRKPFLRPWRLSHNLPRRARGCTCAFMTSKKPLIQCSILSFSSAYTKTGIDGKTWRLIRDWYNHPKSRVRVGNQLSAEFTLERGVLQGSSVLSPVPFLLVIDPLLRELERNTLGPSIYGTYVAFAHADDICTVTSSLPSLQQQINMVQNFTE